VLEYGCVMIYPSFVEDQAYLDMDSTVSEKEQLQAMLSNLTRIHLLTANKFDSLDDLIREYLISGIEVFGLETGIVSQVSEEGVYRVCDVISPLEVLHKGQEFMLEDTYCREVVRSQQVLGFPEVGRLDYMNCHPVYQNLKLEAYLSAPIFVGDSLFGTLNFTSICARTRGFSQHEHNLILLMANSIGSFILIRNKEDRLVALNEKMKRFVGYVAHDLRSPLGSIIGYARMGARDGLSEERLRDIVKKIQQPAERALEFVSTILENAALSTGKLCLVITPVPVDRLLEEVIEAVAIFSHASSVTIHLACDGDVMVECDAKRMHQSLTNLLINAIKYTPKQGKVSVTAQALGEECQISISNLIASEADVKSSEYERLYGSVGFGLDIVREVLNAHNTKLDLTEEGNTYNATFSLRIQ